MRNMLGLSVIAFTVTLAVVVGYRLSSEAMAVVVGIVLGVLASIPTSILLVLLMRRQASEGQRRQTSLQHPHHAYPPVIVINPNAGPATPPNPFYDHFNNQPAGYLPRDFKIVGEDSEDDDW
jgi:hypothetical protein